MPVDYRSIDQSVVEQTNISNSFSFLNDEKKTYFILVCHSFFWVSFVFSFLRIFPFGFEFWMQSNHKIDIKTLFEHKITRRYKIKQQRKSYKIKE